MTPSGHPDDSGVGIASDWSRRHYRQLTAVRVMLATWILFIVVFLCVKGYWWGLALLPFLALDLWLLRNLVRYAQRRIR